MSGGRWFVGSLVQMLPPIVPRLRTWTSAICADDLGEDRPRRRATSGEAISAE